MGDHVVKLDEIARLLAADAGVSWPDLPDHPGFSKGRWRDQARCLIRRTSPEARLVDGVLQWNGRMSDDLVRGFSPAQLLPLPDAPSRRG